MTIFLEPRLPLEFLFSELPAFMSRDAITIAAGSGAAFPFGIVPPGTVLGKVGVNGTAVSAAKASGANTANSGTLTLDATSPLLPFVVEGIYKVRCTVAAAGGGTFRVYDPRGEVVDDIAVGATFSDQLRFVIAAGTADFVKGDGFDITVMMLGGEKYIPAPATSLDGSHVAAAINTHPADTSAGDVQGAAITAGAEVVGVMLTYDPSVTTPAQVAAKTAELATKLIKVR